MNVRPPVLKRLGIVAVSLTLAAPALAQTEDLCGGVGANGQWIGGDEASSDITTADGYLEQLALVLLQNEYVALFSVSDPVDVRVEAMGRGGGDPVIDLRDAAGNIVLSDDDSGGEGASRAEALLQAGDYCVSLSSFDGSPLTGFIRVGRLEHEPLTPGLELAPPPNTDPIVTELDLPPVTEFGCSTLTYFLSDAPIDDQIADGLSVSASVNDVSAWGFTLTEPQSLSITATSATADPLIALYDTAGTFLGENDDFEGLNSRLDFTNPLPAGTYCIDVRALADNNAPITIGIEAFDAAAALSQAYDRGEACPPVDGSHPVAGLGEIGGRFRQDIQTTDIVSWFSVDIVEAGLLVVSTASGNNGDSVLQLCDDFGRELAYNDDAPNGFSYDSEVTVRVFPGTYVIGVRQWGSGSPVPLSLLFERWVPAP